MPAPQERSPAPEAGDAGDALLAAGRALFARRGSRAVTVRDLAAAAGCSHPVISQRFGSKEGLGHAVAEGLAEELAGALRDLPETCDGLATVLGADEVRAALVVRAGLGDLDVAPLAPLEVPRAIARRLERRAGGRPSTPRVRTRITTYAGVATVLGWYTFEDFLVAATDLESLPPDRRRRAVGAIADAVADLALCSEPVLRTARTPPAAAPTAHARDRSALRGPEEVRAALIDAAVHLFAAQGPGGTSTRAVARRAGVNQALIYRYVGSRSELIEAAIEAGSEPLFPAALAATGFDLPTAVRQTRHELVLPRLLARVLIDGIAIRDVRRSFPVLRRLLNPYPSVPSGPGPGDATDPRLAVAAATGMVLGSAVWDAPLRCATGLAVGDLDPALTGIARFVLDLPRTRRARGGS